MSPGPYYDLGGDEVPSTVLSQTQYAASSTRRPASSTARARPRWAGRTSPGRAPSSPPGSVAEYWQTASGSGSGTITGTEAVAKGMNIVMAPANHAYLDQKYRPRSSVPPTLGLTWACNSGCDVDQFYNWDPGNYVTGVTDQNVIGVEGAMWGETVVNLPTSTTWCSRGCPRSPKSAGLRASRGPPLVRPIRTSSSGSPRRGPAAVRRDELDPSAPSALTPAAIGLTVITNSRGQAQGGSPPCPHQASRPAP